MSRFDRSFLNQLLQRVSILEVVGKKVVWDKRKSQPSKGDMWACCPFHGEKSPSFHAIDATGQYHCFGCGEHGNAIDFVMKTENIGFAGAVEDLARSAGIEIPKESFESQEASSKTKKLLDIIAEARKLYSEALIKDDGKIARQYLQRRGIKPEFWETYGLGYSPNSRSWIKDKLTARGFLIEDILAAGLLRKPDDDGAPYDLYRNRLMFAIEDNSGKTISFGARALSDEVMPKYLNGPETPIFSKSHTLYRFKNARPKAKTMPIIVSEGYMDVIALEMAGFAAVAPLGTAFTLDQLTLAWRAHPRPILCFDGDEAGQRAAKRAIEKALPALKVGKTLGFAVLPKGEDPDDIIKNYGKAKMSEFIDNALGIAQFLFDLEVIETGHDTPEAKAQMRANLRAKINEIKDKDLKTEIGFEIKSLLDNAFGRNQKTMDKPPQTSNAPFVKNNNFGKRGVVAIPTSELKTIYKKSIDLKGLKGGKAQPITREISDIIGAAIFNPAIIKGFEEQFVAIDFGSSEINQIRNIIMQEYFDNNPIDFASLNSHFEVSSNSRLIEILNTMRATPINPYTKKGLEANQGQTLWRKAIEKYEEKKALELDTKKLISDSNETESLEKLSKLVVERRNLDKIGEIGD